ncbi:polysaccharide deacetylase family protein [Candidatus Saccharibacteria bacterium]|nr:polysaccharide deacetylase family protein [Candidatus Saccharibacteria bacterium]
MNGGNNSSDPARFRSTRKNRRYKRVYQEYRNKHRPRVFKIATLALVVMLGVLAVVITPTRHSATPKSPTAALELSAPIAIEDLKNYKLVALTFDDGPDPNTIALLDVLKKEKVVATFFVLGARVDRYSEIVEREYREGHQVASHTTNHKDLTKLSSAARQAEITSTAAAIERVTGAKPTVMRPPYGAWNAGVLNEAGTPLILWSIDPKDWEYRDPDRIYQHVMANVRDGSIILLHDVYGTSVETAAKIIPALKEQGYILVTVDRLIMTRGGSFEAGNQYRHLYP